MGSLTMEKFQKQLKLMLWKRLLEYKRNKLDLFKVIGIPMLGFSMVLVFYATVFGLTKGGLEAFFIPFFFWMYTQRIVVTIVHEKSEKLLEAMLMMGLEEPVYWISYLISEGIVCGSLTAFVCALLSLGGLFDGSQAPYGGGSNVFFPVFGFIFIYLLATVSFSFAIASLFDKAANASQGAIWTNAGCLVLVTAGKLEELSTGLQRLIVVLLPPVGLTMGAGSTLGSYQGLPMQEITGYLFLSFLIYIPIAWYIQQVRPSEYGVKKPFYFLFSRDYWLGPTAVATALMTTPLPVDVEAEAIPAEKVDESFFGAPKVVVKNLLKTFGSQIAVNQLSFNMYENQIYCLLGHNGAGKTTTISMLTGLIEPDSTDAESSVYGASVNNNMEGVRSKLGVCPQHDVLFASLSVEEHILLFAELKGYSATNANTEMNALTAQFHLSDRKDHLGSQLSGGQKRKLSVAIAVCGGSRFVVLDEPTAGMDPLARRELWDLLSSLRKGRTMLLTTHYMDEADVLGDRIAIMSLGKLQCEGSSQFLKSTFGAGYKLQMDLLTVTAANGEVTVSTIVNKQAIERKVLEGVPGSTLVVDDTTDDTRMMFQLPFAAVETFGAFFYTLESSMKSIGVRDFGVNITSMEDVFLKVGSDHTVIPKVQDGQGIGSMKYEHSFLTQLLGIYGRKMNIARNDLVVQFTVIIPLLISIVAAILFAKKLMAPDAMTNNILYCMITGFLFILVPGGIGEFIVRERQTKLRNLLVVMGCDFRAYWLGTFLADMTLLFIVYIVMVISWSIAEMDNFTGASECYFILLFFLIQIIAFAYMCSWMFTEARSAIYVTPSVILGLIISPNLLLGIIFVVFDNGLGLFSLDGQTQGGIILWGLAFMTPCGNYFGSMLDAVYDTSGFITFAPSWSDCLIISIVESAVFFAFAYWMDLKCVAVLQKEVLGENEIDIAGVALVEKKSKTTDRESGFDEIVNELGLDSSEEVSDDVKAEYQRVKQMKPESVPLLISGLRKVFKATSKKKPPLVATAGMNIAVNSGEIFGLLGANGAGKTTALSMLTRHLSPTAGDATLGGYSILNQFMKASSHLGVVTQDNSLWDLLSVEDHLALFGRLRGVPEDKVKNVVTSTIDQLELTPHRTKLAKNLSGGMKRKLCVAIALIGDPDVCLLDEPSAGLDPVSRRNLWNVILRTMSHRSVILTTHSMEEAEALCQRIGIMVRGQIRVLGTKQHLKNSYGSGYEVVIKLSSKVEDKMGGPADAITKVVTSMFSNATVVSNNAGLITYKVPQDQMMLSKAFSELEKNKTKLNIENYSVSQPTLEQVFIRIVEQHTPEVASPRGERESMSTLDNPHGSTRFASEALNDPNFQPTADNDKDDDDCYSKICPSGRSDMPKNPCGCTIHLMREVVAACLFILIVVLIITFSGAAPAGAAIFIMLIATLLAVIVWQCACCQPKVEE